MSGQGNCWDNAESESFFSTFKLDKNSDRLLTRWELQRETAFWIEGCYNRE
jgi:transposase InsO family protein